MNMQNIDSLIHEAAFADLAHLKERTSRSYRIADVKSEKGKPDPNRGWTHETIYTFTNGETVTLNGRFAGQLIFPASPGYELLQFVQPEKSDPKTYDIKSLIVRKSIIGWLIESDFHHEWCVPITSEGPDTTSGQHLFKAMALPDGRIEWRSRTPSGEKLGIEKDLQKWIGQVRRHWEVQLELEAEQESKRLEAQKPCPQCGRGGRSFDQEIDDEIPF